MPLSWSPIINDAPIRDRMVESSGELGLGWLGGGQRKPSSAPNSRMRKAPAGCEFDVSLLRPPTPYDVLTTTITSSRRHARQHPQGRSSRKSILIVAHRNPQEDRKIQGCQQQRKRRRHCRCDPQQNALCRAQRREERAGRGRACESASCRCENSFDAEHFCRKFPVALIPAMK